MCNNLYWYYNIRSDKYYSKKLLSKEIVKILDATGCLKRVGPQSFVNDDNFPWLNINCVMSNNGNWVHNYNDSTRFCNLIDIVASRGNAADESKYISLLSRLANELGWELMLEEDNNENENIILNEQ